MVDVKHTPTPWVAVSNGSYWIIKPENRNDDDPYQVGDVCSSYPEDCYQGLQEANAAHIVKCVNMHDELVEVLSKFMDFKDSDYVPNNMFKRAEEALKKARGE